MEENGRNLCAGDGVLRSSLAIAVANDVCEVVCVIQTQCIIILDFYGRFFLFFAAAITTVARGMGMLLVGVNVVECDFVVSYGF